MLEKNKIYCMNCIDGLKRINDNSIDLTVTSPPYKKEDGFTYDLISNVANQLYRVQKNNSLCFINFGHLAHFKNRPFRVAMLFEEAGFDWIDTFVWVKNHYTPIQGSKRVNNLTDFIFMFAKGNNYKLDRLSIGIPYKDKSNIGRYSNRDLKCRGNVWHIPYDTIQYSWQKKHKDRFPKRLPEMCIKLSNIHKESLVLDPFMGGGTTAVVSKQLDMNFIGFELDQEDVDMSYKWLNEENLM